MDIVRSSVEQDTRGDAVARVRRLLRRKQSEKARLVRDIQEIARSIMSLFARQTESEAIQGEIHALFARAIEKQGLSARERRAVRSLYEDLQQEGTITQNPAMTATGVAATDDGLCMCPACIANREAQARFDQGPSDERASESWQQPASPATDQRDQGLRDLYRDLALRCHPDRAEDEASRKHRETMMREVNAAYHSGDTEGLLRLSQELGLDIEHLRSADGVLAELVRQYEDCKAEVRALRRSPPGEMVVACRHARRYGYPTPIEEFEVEVDMHYETGVHIRDYVRAFVHDKIDVETFLAGPYGDDSSELDDELEELALLSALDALLGQLSVAGMPVAAKAHPAAKTNGRGKKGRAKRKRRRRTKRR